jgi:hypothetical protein
LCVLAVDIKGGRHSSASGCPRAMAALLSTEERTIAMSSSIIFDSGR